MNSLQVSSVLMCLCESSPIGNGTHKPCNMTTNSFFLALCSAMLKLHKIISFPEQILTVVFRKLVKFFVFLMKSVLDKLDIFACFPFRKVDVILDRHLKKIPIFSVQKIQVMVMFQGRIHKHT